VSFEEACKHVAKDTLRGFATEIEAAVMSDAIAASGEDANMQTAADALQLVYDALMQESDMDSDRLCALVNGPSGRSRFCDLLKTIDRLIQQ